MTSTPLPVVALKSLPGILQFDLTGHVAIVTGGSKGLGAAMAAGLASAGAMTVIVSRTLSESQDIAAEISAGFSVPSMGFQADVAKPSDVEQLVAAVMAQTGRIDILINSAGINIRGSISDLTYEEFQAVQKINVDGTWLCCKAVIPHMKAAGYGRIVNVASTLGVVGLANRTPYTNALCPGPFLTPMNIPIADTEEAKKHIIGAVALDRWGQLNEIQGAAILLSSPAGSYMTGSLLTVDGGWTAK